MYRDGYVEVDNPTIKRQAFFDLATGALVRTARDVLLAGADLGTGAGDAVHGRPEHHHLVERSNNEVGMIRWGGGEIHAAIGVY